MQHPSGPGRRRRLLVPVRLEAVGEGKLGVVAEQAHGLSAEVVLLHVLTRADLDPANVRPTEARARTYLETVAAHLEELGVRASTVVRSGPPATTIVAEATAIDAMLIVLGASAHHWLSRLVLGSMADEVVHTAPCPVLLVRPERRGCSDRHGVRSFAEDAARAGAIRRRHLGVRTIEVARIIGSVDRAGELGPDFRRRGAVRPGSTEDQRFQRVLKATTSGANLPPIAVYKLGFGYYVEDGHHRLAAALLTGQTEIDADVTECLSATDEQAAALFAARAGFEHATGLTDVGAARAETYTVLQRTIAAFARQEGIAELGRAACRWEGSIYRPLWREIRARQVCALFPGERTADIVARLARWREETSRDSWTEALAAVARATPTPAASAA